MNPETPARRLPVFRTIIAGLLALVLLGLVAAAVVKVQSRPAPGTPSFMVLTNGARIDLIEVTAGRKKHFASQKPWQHFVRPMLPGSLRKQLPPNVQYGGIIGPEDGLRIIFRYRPGPPVILMGATIEDDAGFQYGASENAAGGTNGDCYIFLEPPAYPRRQQDFLVHLLGPAGTYLATFRVRNPAPNQYPEWKPAALPQTLTNGLVKLTLASLTPYSGSARPLVQVHWLLEPSAPSWADAAICDTRLLDATGNEIEAFGSPDSDVLSALSPREPAWKVRALVRRADSRELPPADKAIITNVTVSNNPSRLPLHAHDAAENLTIDVQQYTQLQAAGSNISFAIAAVIHHPQKDDALFFSARDNLGRLVSGNSLRGGWVTPADGSRNYSLNVDIPSDAATFDLEVYINRPLILDFLVDPKDVKPPAP